MHFVEFRHSARSFVFLNVAINGYTCFYGIFLQHPEQSGRFQSSNVSRTHNMSLHNTHNVIIGLGNKALSDDAAGIKVARYLVKNHPNPGDLQIIDAGMLHHKISSVLENAHNLIIVQAATLGHAPGTISTLVGKDMDRILKRAQRNSNEMALADMFEMARLARCLPPNRALVTVEPKKVSWGNRLSACVSRAIPQLADRALSLMSLWTGIPTQKEPEQETNNESSNSHSSHPTQQIDN